MKKFLPAILTNVTAALSEILLMASAAWLIASAALHPPLSSLSVGITLVRTAGISRAVLRYVDRLLTHKTIFKMLDDLRERLFRRAAAKLPLKSGKSDEGELLHELTVTADALKDLLPRVILPISTALLVTVLLTYLLILRIGIVALILPTIFLIALIPLKFNEADDTNYREKILDYHEGVDELRIYGATPAINKLNDCAESFGKAHVKVQTRKNNFDTLINILAAGGICIILYELSASVDRIELTVWSLILIATLEVIGAVPNAIRNYKKFPSTGGTNVFTLDVATGYAVEFSDVNFGYNSQAVIKNINLKIKRGEHWAIIGESGAGKTTMLNLMMKLFKADSGSVAINGTVAAATSTNYIFSESIRANFNIYATDADIVNVMKICQLEDFDVDAAIGEDGANLSGGERVRLQIALAIAKNPDILILDEPTSGIDKSRAGALIDAIINNCQQKNRTLIIITHDLNIANKLDNIFNLNQSD